MILNLIFVLWFSGIICFLLYYDTDNKILKKQVKKLNLYRNRKKKELTNSKMNELLKSAGVPINLYHLELFRTFLISICILLILIGLFQGGELPLKQIVILLLFYVLSIPKEKIFNYTSPIIYITNLFLKNQRQNFDDELFMAISQLKNTFLIKKDKPPSSLLILEQVHRYTVNTKPIFSNLLSYWQMGEKEEGVKYFEKAVGTKQAQNLGSIFLKLDDIHPAEMTMQLEMFQDMYRSSKETQKLRTNEVKSRFLFVSILVVCILVMMNFLNVVYFIDFIKDTQSFLN